MQNKFICDKKDVRLDVFLTENTTFSQTSGRGTGIEDG